jgi:hypothetical protein
MDDVLLRFAQLSPAVPQFATVCYWGILFSAVKVSGLCTDTRQFACAQTNFLSTLSHKMRRICAESRLAYRQHSVEQSARTLHVA